MGQNLDTKAAYAEQAAAEKPKRVCTDCGKPTHNYRCDKYWKKKRGYGFDESGDEATVTTEARQRMRLNDAAARQERKEARGQDWFVPSTKYGQPPPAPPPGEQKRIVPAMPEKGHKRQWPRSTVPLAGGWMPKRRTKEKEVSPPMQEEKKNWTVVEVAAEAGIGRDYVYNILAQWRRGKGQNLEAGKVLKATLDRLGLRWEELGRPGKRRASAAKEAAAPQVEAAVSASAAEAEAPEAPGLLEWQTRMVKNRQAAVDTLGRIIAERADEEKERRAAGVGVAHPAVDADTLDRIIDELTAEEAEEEPAPAREAFRPERPDYGRDFQLGHVPMEAMVAEITRRVPRAQVVLC